MSLGHHFMWAVVHVISKYQRFKVANLIIIKLQTSSRRLIVCLETFAVFTNADEFLPLINNNELRLFIVFSWGLKHLFKALFE